MFLKNYTSEVPVSVTIDRIMKLLIKVGVSSISTDYGAAGEIIALTFVAPLADKKVPIRLPVDEQAAIQALWLDYADPDALTGDGQAIGWSSRKRKTRKDFVEQGKRTAWRLMQDWLEVQVSMIQLRQADVLQVFLPYAWDGKQSFYAAIKATGFRALMPARDVEGAAHE